MKHKSKTYRKWTPCDNIYVTIVYRNDEPDKIDFIRIHGASRNNMCGASWIESMADMQTLLLSRLRLKYKGDVESLIASLANHRCNKYTPNKYGIKSCVDALRKVYEKEFEGVLAEEKTNGKKT